MKPSVFPRAPPLVKLGKLPPAPVGVTSVRASEGWMLVNGWPGESARAVVRPARTMITVQAPKDVLVNATSHLAYAIWARSWIMTRLFRQIIVNTTATELIARVRSRRRDD